MRLGMPARPRNRSLDDALLPLVNIVFLLMVFFLAAGRLNDGRPTRATPQSQASGEAPRPAAAVLQLGEGGVLTLGGETFPESQLPGRAIALKGTALDVRADGHVPAERVLRLLAVLRAAQVTDVRLLTVRGATP